MSSPQPQAPRKRKTAFDVARLLKKIEAAQIEEAAQEKLAYIYDIYTTIIGLQIADEAEKAAKAVKAVQDMADIAKAFHIIHETAEKVPESPDSRSYLGQMALSYLLAMSFTLLTDSCADSPDAKIEKLSARSLLAEITLSRHSGSAAAGIWIIYLILVS